MSTTLIIIASHPIRSNSTSSLHAAFACAAASTDEAAIVAVDMMVEPPTTEVLPPIAEMIPPIIVVGPPIIGYCLQ
ncbi:uncharacterized protein PAC_14256 [Phialocephala subalpina]|uniref:Uncharacterized protein n=1 Tax=Phialocephala subalpina TaxID=576137 RepID=A0A1L7XH63_9HELO|nr:uncharacterized protein PAC_14256 [Phialocephala subalpina]